LFPAEFHAQLTYLSGPSFAREVAMGIPTAVLVAGRNAAFTEAAQHAFTNSRLRVYSTDDVTESSWAARSKTWWRSPRASRTGLVLATIPGLP